MPWSYFGLNRLPSNSLPYTKFLFSQGSFRLSHFWKYTWSICWFLTYSKSVNIEVFFYFFIWNQIINTKIMLLNSWKRRFWLISFFRSKNILFYLCRPTSRLQRAFFYILWSEVSRWLKIIPLLIKAQVLLIINFKDKLTILFHQVIWIHELIDIVNTKFELKMLW